VSSLKKRLCILLFTILVILASMVSTTAPAQAATNRVAILFPFDGNTWLSGEGPGQHHVIWNAWSEDLHAPVGTAVKARFASSDGAVTLSVASISDTCGAPNNAGKNVTVNVYIGGTYAGQVIYGHLNSVAVSQGASISLDTTLGYLNNWAWSSCWQDTTADGVVHTHIEVAKGCYRNLSPWTNYSQTTAIGMVAGSYGSSNVSTCDENEVQQVVGGSGSSAVMFTNGGGETYANANPIGNPWTKLSNSTNAISASGGYTAWIDGCGAAWATSNFALVSATQLTVCNGATAIAIGPSGNVIFVNSCGAAHATNTYNNPQSWVMLTGCGGAVSVTAGGGGTGRVGVINSCGALNVTENYQSWTQIAPCGGAQKVSLGPNGTLAFTNGCGALYATSNYTDSGTWVQITGCGGTTKFAVGTDKRLVFVDSCGSAHGTMTYDSSSSWVVLTGCNGAQAVAIGTGGQTGVINSCGALNITANFQSWTAIAPCSGASRVAIA